MVTPQPTSGSVSVDVALVSALMLLRLVTPTLSRPPVMSAPARFHAGSLNRLKSVRTADQQRPQVVATQVKPTLHALAPEQLVATQVKPTLHALAPEQLVAHAAERLAGLAHRLGSGSEQPYPQQRRVKHGAERTRVRRSSEHSASGAGTLRDRPGLLE